MRVAVVGGTAGIGYGIALRLAKAGGDVVIGGRQAEKSQRVAGEARSVLPDATISGNANEDAVVDRDLVVVTVPYPGLADTYKMLKERMSPGTVVLDCNVPLASEVGGKPTRLLGIWEGSAAQQAKGILGKDFPVASGFHTVMAGKLIKVESWSSRSRGPASSIVGRLRTRGSWSLSPPC
jgi:NADPH-dependent F420 reductase